MKRINLCALLLAVMLIPDVSYALECPGTQVYTRTGLSGVFVIRRAFPGSAATFIGGGCSTVSVGAPAPGACGYANNSGSHYFFAQWSNATQRNSAKPSGGCSFMCQGTGPMGTASPSCFVRAEDGLPVELMEFSVDE